MARFKGWIGEKKTALKLWLSLRKKTYPRFHDVILPSKNGTSQLDHLIISIYGIFIIETKNKDGWIFGSADKAQWTQTFYKKKFSFQNPLRQTFRQKKVLAAFLEVDEALIHDVVYFIGKSTFRTAMPENVLDSSLGGYIKRFRNPVLTTEEVEDLTNKIKLHISQSNLTTKDHIQSIEERKNSDILCPKCGSILVLRTTKRGPKAGKSFLGCSSYPKCRFTKEVNPLEINEFHKASQKLAPKASAPSSEKPTFPEWLQKNPGKSVNDYYSKFGK